MGNIEHLSIYINGVRLDEIISKVNERYLGLIPAWLDYYDKDLESSINERKYVLEKTKLSEEIKILPILLCPEDFDFSCTVIVVEVILRENMVIWNRFGVDITPFDEDEKELPQYIGKEVVWIKEIDSFKFSRRRYLHCVEQFGIIEHI